MILTRVGFAEGKRAQLGELARRFAGRGALVVRSPYRDAEHVLRIPVGTWLIDVVPAPGG